LIWLRIFQYAIFGRCSHWWKRIGSRKVIDEAKKLLERWDRGAQGKPDLGLRPRWDKESAKRLLREAASGEKGSFSIAWVGMEKKAGLPDCPDSPSVTSSSS